MIRFSFQFPKYRLQILLSKRRGAFIDNSLLPDLEKIKNIRRGQKLSRFFRLIFERRKIKKLLGTNLALILLISTFIPNNSLANIENEQVIITESNSPLITKSAIQYPVSEIRISQEYQLFHPGLDFDGETGDEIRPIKNGVVEMIGKSKFAYGNTVIINHGGKITSLYAHLSKISVLPGQEVTTDTIIGEMGSSGQSSGSHLHLEIRDHGVPINPLSVLPKY